MRRRVCSVILVAMLGGVATTACVLPAPPTPPERSAPGARSESRARVPDVIFVPTHPSVVDAMLGIADVKGSDVVYDLGCGDGGIVITAARRFGVRATGVDVDAERIREARANARKAGVLDRVRLLQQDLFETDISEATVVTLYLSPEINLRLRPKFLRELKPGTRIVSHDFDMGDWLPERSVRVALTNRNHHVYLWRVPTPRER